MKTFILKSAIFILFINAVCGWRHFWKGRKVNGNLGGPTHFHLELESGNEDLWFTQLLDHFEPLNRQTWNQRYYVNDEYFKPNGPVFLMIGGEGEATSKWMHKGAWMQYAKKFGALCFQLEHRFYGKSRPTPDLSTENLRFLSSEQALADLAYFIKRMNEKYNLTSNKWIAFGGSYPGSLAAWLREKYPHLVYGSISTSGPLLAKIDFHEYFEVVRDSLSTYKGCDCVTKVQQAIQQVDVLLKHMIGQRTLNEKFVLCDPIEKSIDNPLDIANLFEGLAGDFAGVVQYNKDNRDGNPVTIDDVCGVMCNQTIGVPVTRLAEVNKMILLESKQKCFDYKYDKMIDQMKNTSWDSEVSEGGRQWTYQTCTEFGFYQTSDKPNLLFGDKFPADFFVKQCTDIYGDSFNFDALNGGIDRTNIIYGALKPETTNVLYVHGSIDPWHALGLTETNKNQRQPTIYIQGTAHCANMYEPSEKDFPQLKKAREAISKYIEALVR
ncbi:putative serine protease F56F10.1 [Chironomus tepperi]|uniref:putative serine protease F56F10.1 n=1 Tax=Chironomus tepperi TaxID=113505 RepID=UPI00391F76E6